MVTPESVKQGIEGSLACTSWRWRDGHFER